jgi:hypothetical protein
MKTSSCVGWGKKLPFILSDNNIISYRLIVSPLQDNSGDLFRAKNEKS